MNCSQHLFVPLGKMVISDYNYNTNGDLISQSKFYRRSEIPVPASFGSSDTINKFQFFSPIAYAGVSNIKVPIVKLFPNGVQPLGRSAYLSYNNLPEDIDSYSNPTDLTFTRSVDKSHIFISDDSTHFYVTFISWKEPVVSSPKKSRKIAVEEFI